MWFTGDLWEMLERCWSPKPEYRPTVESILEHLERGSAVWQPLPPCSDGEVQSDVDGASTVDYHTSMFPRFVPNPAPQALSVGQMVSQDGGTLPVSSHSHPHSVADPVVASGGE